MVSGLMIQLQIVFPMDINWFQSSGKYNEKYNAYMITWYIVKHDGTEINLSKALGLGKYEEAILRMLHQQGKKMSSHYSVDSFLSSPGSTHHCFTIQCHRGLNAR